MINKNLLFKGFFLFLALSTATSANAQLKGFLDDLGGKIEKELENFIDEPSNNSTPSKAPNSYNKMLILNIQRELYRLGYQIKVDGEYGPGTTNAILLFETATGRKPLGQATPDILTALRQVNAPTNANLQANKTKNNIILDIQKELKRLGHDIVVDGLNGPGTKSAIIKFQRKIGASQTGKINLNLLNTMKEIKTEDYKIHLNKEKQYANENSNINFHKNVNYSEPVSSENSGIVFCASNLKNLKYVFDYTLGHSNVNEYLNTLNLSQKVKVRPQEYQDKFSFGMAKSPLVTDWFKEIGSGRSIDNGFMGIALFERNFSKREDGRTLGDQVNNSKARSDIRNCTLIKKMPVCVTDIGFYVPCPTSSNALVDTNNPDVVADVDAFLAECQSSFGFRNHDCNCISKKYKDERIRVGMHSDQSSILNKIDIDQCTLDPNEERFKPKAVEFAFLTYSKYMEPNASSLDPQHISEQREILKGYKKIIMEASDKEFIHLISYARQKDPSYQIKIIKLLSERERYQAEKRKNTAIVNLLSSTGKSNGSTINSSINLIDEFNKAEDIEYRARSREYALEGKVCKAKPEVVYCFSKIDSTTSYLGQGWLQTQNYKTFSCNRPCNGHEGFCNMETGEKFFSARKAEENNCRKASETEIKKALEFP